MKKLTCFILLFALLSGYVFADQPTVTRAVKYSKDYITTKFTFTTDIANTDSVFLGLSGTAGDDDKSYWDLNDFTAASTSDSLVSVWFSSNEATADSTRLTALWQYSYDWTASTSADFVTGSTDATSFTNVSTALAGFRPQRHGDPGRLRLILFENDTNKDASQTITIYVRTPRRTTR